MSARWVRPDTHEVCKFMPHNPPWRGETVLVDGEPCRVLRCPVKYEGLAWQMGKRGVKVKPLCPHSPAFLKNPS